MLIGLAPQMFGKMLPVSITYRSGGYIDGSAIASHTYSSKALGNGGLIVVAVTRSNGNGTISSLTVAGVTATQIAVANGTHQSCFQFYVRVPNGTTTGNVVITWGGSTSQSSIHVFTVENAITDAPYAFTVGAGGSDAARSASVNVPADGGAIWNGPTGDTATVWTGATGAPAQGPGVFYGGAASANFATAQTPATATGTKVRVIIGASWR